VKLNKKYSIDDIYIFFKYQMYKKNKNKLNVLIRKLRKFKKVNLFSPMYNNFMSLKMKYIKFLIKNPILYFLSVFLY